MRFFDEIRDNSGYYYVDDKMNLNDFVLMIAFVFLMVGLYVVYLIYPGKEEWESFDIIMNLLVVGFSIPFVVHFTDRAVKFIGFKLKKNKTDYNRYKRNEYMWTIVVLAAIAVFNTVMMGIKIIIGLLFRMN